MDDLLHIRRRFAWIVRSSRSVRLSRGVLTQIGPAFRTRRLCNTTVECVVRCKCGQSRTIEFQKLRFGKFEKCSCPKPLPWIVANKTRKRIRENQLVQIGPMFRTRRYTKSMVEAVFECSCGRYDVFPANRVEAGDIKSCGCRMKRKPEHSLLVDSAPVSTPTLTQAGQAFRAFLGGEKRTLAVFRCRCERYCIQDVHRVSSHEIKSCGCRRSVPDHLKKLASDLAILRMRHSCGESVGEVFLNPDDIISVQALHSAIGADPGGVMLAMNRPGRGWCPGNLKWQPVAEFLSDQRTALLAHTLEQSRLMGRRSGLVQRSWQTGSDAQIMGSIVKDCGPCPSVNHILQRIDGKGEWVSGNVAWLAKNSEAAELLLLLKRRIQRARKPKRDYQKSIHRWYVLDGEKLSLDQLASRVGINRSSMEKRLRRFGNDVAAAVAAPVAVERRTR